MASTWDDVRVTWDDPGTWDGSTTISGTGMQLIGDPGRLLIQLAPGADRTADESTWPWIDVTGIVYFDDGLKWTVGRGDEVSTATPASCSFSLLDDTGDWVSDNPTSPHYPNVRRNMPCRVSFDPTGAGTAYRVMFAGEVYSMPPQAVDTKGVVFKVMITATGALRQRQQRSNPVQSPLYRSTLALGPVDYYPMEDDASATAVAPASDDLGYSLPETGMQFAQNSDLTGSKPLPTFGDAGAVAGNFVGTTSGHYQLDWWMNTTEPSAVTTVMALSCTGTIKQWRISTQTGLIGIQGYDNAGNLVVNINSLPEDFYTGWRHVRLYVKQSGSSCAWGFSWGNPFPGGITWGLGGSYAGTVGTPTRWAVPNSPGISGVSMGHVALFDAYDVAVSAAAGNGYIGELAHTRILRVAAENGLPVTLSGSSNIAMGAQPVADTITILRDAEKTDGGVLYDGQTVGGIGYLCRSSRYNPATSMTLDYAAGDVGSPFAPADDDQRNVNDYTASQTGGSSARFIDVDGELGTDAIGTYPGSDSFNTSDATPLLQRAAWEVHLGTLPGLRWPSLNLDLRARPGLIAPFVAAPLVSWRADIANVRQVQPQYPPGPYRTIVEGYTATMDLTRWTVAANCSSAEGLFVGVVGSTDRIGPDATFIADAGTQPPGTTTFHMTGQDIWTQSAVTPTDFPFDIIINGERMTVTAIAGATLPQTWTVTRAVNGVSKSTHALDAVELYRPPVIAL